MKTIKFNLILDDQPVRNIEGLRDNFNIDDILKYHKNGLLKKWLSVRGYEQLLEQVESIQHHDDLLLAKDLVRIFEIKIDLNQIEEALYSIKYYREWNQIIDRINRSNFESSQLISEYFNGYEQLLESMFKNDSDMSLVKSVIKQISEHYLDIFKLHLPSFCINFSRRCPLAIFAILMNDIAREAYFSHDLIEKDDILRNFSMSEDNLVWMVSKSPDSFTSDTKIISIDTYLQWQALENPDQKVYVIDMTNDIQVKVKCCGNDDNIAELGYEDALGKVFSGLEFYSNSHSHYVKYIKLSESIISSKLEDEKISSLFLHSLLKNHIKVNNLVTGEYWDVLEPKGKKYMIISLCEGAFVRSQGNDGQKLSAEDIRNKYPILDGLDYKSNNPDYEIGYLEV